MTPYRYKCACDSGIVGMCNCTPKQREKRQAMAERLEYLCWLVHIKKMREVGMA